MKQISFIVTAALLAVVSLYGHDVLAKGGSSVPSSAQSCEYSWDASEGHIRYPLEGDSFPGVVWVDMSTNGSNILFDSVCYQQGWSAEKTTISNGVSVRFFYNGEKAIDFKYVSGKTDVRYF